MAGTDKPGRTDDPRLRVLIMASWYPDEHAQHAGIFIQQQADAMAAYFDVAVLHVRQGGSRLEPWFTREGDVAVVRGSLQLIDRPSRRLDRWRILWRITLGYRREVLHAYHVLLRSWGAPDIVHVHASFPAAIGARAVHRRFGIPYVITEHQAEYLPASPGFIAAGGRLRPALVKRAMQKASAVIAVSSYLARGLIVGGYYPHPTVIPNLVWGVERDLGEWRPHEGPPRAVHVSLMRAHEKNIPMLLEALRLIDSRGHDLEFVFVGNGPDRADMEMLAANLGLGGKKARFLGARTPDEVAALYRDSDFSVVSSRYETFCLAAAESIAAGCPVVSTRCGGPEDFIDDHVGLLVENDDADAMADGIVWMMEHSREYDRSEMRRLARNRFSATSVASQILGVYARVLGADAGESRGLGRAPGDQTGTS